MANLNRTTRKVHYWVAAAILLPVLVVTVSGVLLQVKKQSSWVQPDEHLGTGTVPEVTLVELLNVLQEMPELGVSSWDDVDRLDVRPGKGMTKVRLRSGYEVQVDMGTGEVLQVEYRRTDLIESLHDGSWFGGDWTKLGLFLPSAVGLFVLCVSGVWLFILPIRARRRQRAHGR